MIYAQGHLVPTKEQREHIRKYADDSFCSNASDKFSTNIPVFDGWQAHEVVLLKCKNVEPHDDPWVGRGVGPSGADPRTRRAIFWVLDAGKNFDYGMWFGTDGSKPIQLKTNDYVVFDDRRIHWVMAKNQWFGASTQLSKIA